MNDQSSPITENHPHNETLRQLNNLSYILDNSIPIPGTSYRILGLFPAVGDYLGTGISAYIIIKSAQMGASKATLSRMTLNIILETILGTVPMIGDIFDAGWKANLRNMALLQTHLNSPQTRQKSDWWFLILLLGIILLILVITTAITVYLLSLLINILT
jgi:hypothetical protein